MYIRNNWTGISFVVYEKINPSNQTNVYIYSQFDLVSDTDPFYGSKEISNWAVYNSWWHLNRGTIFNFSVSSIVYLFQDREGNSLTFRPPLLLDESGWTLNYPSYGVLSVPHGTFEVRLHERRVVYLWLRTDLSNYLLDSNVVKGVTMVDFTVRRE